MPADLQDPVPSPAPAADPSPAASPAPVATPEPANGVPAASPPVSDKAPASAPAKAAAPADPSKGESPVKPEIAPLGEGDVLDRLTAPTTKTEPTPVSTPEPAAPAPSAENPDAPAEAETAEDAPFVPADEKELAGYHSRTRHRIKQFQRELDKQKPFVEFADGLIQRAAEHNLSVQSVVGWQNLGFGIRKGDPEALQALAGILESHGIAPAVAPDLSPVEAVIAKLHQSLDINDEGKAALLQALAPLKKAPEAQKPAAPVQRQAPAPQPQRQPAPDPLVATANWVGQREAQLAAQHGQKWPELRKAIYAEAARREAALPPHLVNDPVELRVRHAACVEHVLARAAAPKPSLPSVQPSLRASPSPLPIPVPKRGAIEYDDYVMTHGVPPKT